MLFVAAGAFLAESEDQSAETFVAAETVVAETPVAEEAAGTYQTAVAAASLTAVAGKAQIDLDQKSAFQAWSRWKRWTLTTATKHQSLRCYDHMPAQ